ncbi:MAG: helix-turn-helix transcriptional regulator [Candidatus Eisenbacteria bacterium]|nr:helix-turn-helix transcriptional regulator [Candidatus Eisenbacteria bacterium]
MNKLFVHLTPRGRLGYCSRVPRTTAPALYRQIGDRIAAKRRERRPLMSQQGLATAAGVSRATIVNIERGRHRVQLHVLYDIARALGAGVQDLLPRLSASAPPPLPQDILTKLKPDEVASVGRLLEDTHGGQHGEQ